MPDSSVGRFGGSDEAVDRALNTFVVTMQKTGTTREGLRAVLDEVAAERDRFREALIKINGMGAVCADFMECEHRSCRDSCGAKLTALAALEGEADA